MEASANSRGMHFQIGGCYQETTSELQQLQGPSTNRREKDYRCAPLVRERNKRNGDPLTRTGKAKSKEQKQNKQKRKRGNKIASDKRQGANKAGDGPTQKAGSRSWSRRYDQRQDNGDTCSLARQRHRYTVDTAVVPEWNHSDLAVPKGTCEYDTRTDAPALV